MMLAAVETVTKTDPVWESRRHNSDVAAKATARVSVHAASPLNQVVGMFKTNPSGVHERCAGLFGCRLYYRAPACFSHRRGERVEDPPSPASASTHDPTSQSSRGEYVEGADLRLRQCCSYVNADSLLSVV